MSQINKIDAGGNSYDIGAVALTSGSTIDGVQFTGGANVAHYAVCTTAAGTAAKVANITGFALDTGAMVSIKFTYGNTASSPTLDINSLGAKAIMQYGTTNAGSAAWVAGEVVDFRYDGTNWLMASGATGNATVRGKVIVDATPTEGSANAVQSGGAFTMIDNTIPKESVSGSVVAFQDGANNLPLKSFELAGTWSTASLRHTGTNLVEFHTGASTKVCDEISAGNATSGTSFTLSTSGDTITIKKPGGPGANCLVERIWSIPTAFVGGKLTVSVNSITAIGSATPALAIFVNSSQAAWFSTSANRQSYTVQSVPSGTITFKFWGDVINSPGSAGDGGVFYGIQLQCGDAVTDYNDYVDETLSLTSGVNPSVNTYYGGNTLWANGSGVGQMAVTYRADTQMYIDKEIASLQALVLSYHS